MCCCNAKHIAQYGRSRATLDATGHCHWASFHPVSPQHMPWLVILASKIELWHCEITFQKLAFNRHKTDPLLSSSKQQTA
jgi:hypothetical protein